MTSKKTFVINARGKKEPFSFQKVYRSAKRVGASDAIAQDIAEVIQAEVYPGVKTIDIFRKIKKLLASKSPAAAIKFSLKEGMRKLGPTGYPFENYIQEILARNNFKTEEAQIVSGRCTEYEIDFLAYSQSKISPDFPYKSESVFYIGECKYHHAPGARVDLEVALAHYARFIDIRDGPLTKSSSFEKLEARALLTTNTKFTKKAINYASCIGMDLLGWNYPQGKGLEYLIGRQMLYPVTVLPSLKGNLVELFLNNKIVLVEDVLRLNSPKVAQELDVSIKTVQQIIQEAKLLIG